MKPWYTSKTMWANIALIMVGVQQNMQVIEASIPPIVFGYLLFGVGVLNVILRVVTTSAVTK